MPQRELWRYGRTCVEYPEGAGRGAERLRDLGERHVVVAVPAPDLRPAPALVTPRGRLAVGEGRREEHTHPPRPRPHAAAGVCNTAIRIWSLCEPNAVCGQISPRE